MSMEGKAMADGVLAAGLVTAPAWVPWLGDLNQILTTISLVVGLALAIARLTAFLRRRE
jgi:uncharacterized protein involved in cysteine biosynthesis